MKFKKKITGLQCLSLRPPLSLCISLIWSVHSLVSLSFMKSLLFPKNNLRIVVLCLNNSNYNRDASNTLLLSPPPSWSQSWRLSDWSPQVLCSRPHTIRPPPSSFPPSPFSWNSKTPTLNSFSRKKRTLSFSLSIPLPTKAYTAKPKQNFQTCTSLVRNTHQLPCWKDAGTKNEWKRTNRGPCKWAMKQYFSNPEAAQLAKIAENATTLQRKTANTVSSDERGRSRDREQKCKLRNLSEHPYMLFVHLQIRSRGDSSPQVFSYLFYVDSRKFLYLIGRETNGLGNCKACFLEPCLQKCALFGHS